MTTAPKQTAKEFLSSFPDHATFEDIDSKLRFLRTDEHRWNVFANVVQKLLAAVAVCWAYKSAGIILSAHTGGSISMNEWSLDKGLPWVCLTWSALPPLWFMFEFWYFFPKLGKSMEEFKYGQELAKSFWKGIAIVLLGVLLKGGG